MVVSAGTFLAFKGTATCSGYETLSDTGNYTSVSNSWYDPNIGTIKIKYKFTYARYNNATVNETWDLTKFEQSCTFSLSSLNQIFDFYSHSGAVDVNASSDTCAWKAYSNASWITVTEDYKEGSNSIDLTLTANTSKSLRIGTISIAGETFTVTQSAPPTISASPAMLSFSNIKQGNTSIAKAVTIKNLGKSNLEINSVSISGTNASDFTIYSNNCPSSLSKGSKCIVAIKYAPSSKSKENSSLTILSNDPNKASSIVTLSGTGK